MNTSIVRFGIDADAGQLWIDEGTLFVGELTDIEIVGYTAREGRAIRLTLLDDDGKTPLADNSANPSKLDMRLAALREKFRGKDILSLKAYAVEVGEGFAADVLAEGLLVVRWSPFVSDAQGEVATLRGPQGQPGKDGNTPYVGQNGNWWVGTVDTGIRAHGDKGEKGDKGERGEKGEIGYKGETIVAVELCGFDSDGAALYDIVTSQGNRFRLRSPTGRPPSTLFLAARGAEGQHLGLWHGVSVRQNERGEWVISVDQTAVGDDQVTEGYVKQTGDQQIDGFKTFLKSPLAPKAPKGDKSASVATTLFVSEAIEDVSEAVESARTVADGAKTAADAATVTAGAAMTAAGSAASKADESKTASDAATATAGEAKTSASSALTVAGEAKTTAESAATVADSAKREAEDAKTVANAAKTAADAALVNIVSAIYPVGAIYIGVQSACPIAAIVGTWEKVTGRYLLASGTLAGSGSTAETYAANSNVAAGLPTPPNHTHTYRKPSDRVSVVYGAQSVRDDVTNYSTVNTGNPTWGTHSIYGASGTVRPKAYVVNVWRRTA